MLLLTSEVRARACTLHVCTSVRQVSRAATSTRATAKRAKAKRSDRGAHIAILDSIVIKRGATAGREPGRCIVVVTSLILWCLCCGEQETLLYCRYFPYPCRSLFRAQNYQFLQQYIQRRLIHQHLCNCSIKNFR